MKKAAYDFSSSFLLFILLLGELNFHHYALTLKYIHNYSYLTNNNKL